MSKSEKSKEDESLGRFLSLILRHNPEIADITLDNHGWAKVDQLLDGCRRAGKVIDKDILERIVKETINSFIPLMKITAKFVLIRDIQYQKT